MPPCHVRERSVGSCGNCRTFDPTDFESTFLTNNGVSGGSKRDDPGLGAITGKPEDRGRFRAPTLRNIELTAPYMHDGRFATLEEVLRFYAHRVRPHPSLDPRLKPGSGTGWTAPSANRGELQAPALGLRLDSRDQADLIAFLKTLTDLEFTTDPRFKDPFAARPQR